MMLPLLYSVHPMSSNQSQSSGHIQDHLSPNHNISLHCNLPISNHSGESPILNHTGHTQPHQIQPQHAKSSSIHTNLSRQPWFMSSPNRTRSTKDSACAKTPMCQNFARYPHWLDHTSPPDPGQHSQKYPWIYWSHPLDTQLLDQQPLEHITQYSRPNHTTANMDDSTLLHPQLAFDEGLCQHWSHHQNTTDNQQLQTLPPSNHTCWNNQPCRHSSSYQINISKPLSPTLAPISTSNYNWPTQLNPSSTTWKIWTKAIQNTYTKPGLPTMLKLPLRPWTHQATMVCTWIHTLNPSTIQIIKQAPHSSMVQYLPQNQTHLHVYNPTTSQLSNLMLPIPALASSQLNSPWLHSPSNPVQVT